MKIIDNFFINRKLKEFPCNLNVMDMKNELSNIKNAVIIWPDSIINVKSIHTVVKSIEGCYGFKPTILTTGYHRLYRELIKSKIHEIDIPKPTKFNELTRIHSIKSSLKSIDLLYDFSDADKRLRAMIKRILKPKVAISFKENAIESDYNILVAANKVPVKLLKMMGLETKEVILSKILDKRKENKNVIEYDYVLVGESSSVKRKMKGLMKRSSKFLYISDIHRKMGIEYFIDIVRAKQIISDSDIYSEICEIRKHSK